MRSHLVLPSWIALALGSVIPSIKQHPIVDLGYVRQQALTYNTTSGFYLFSNIAFAEPPLGALRFAPPQTPKPISGVQNGSNHQVVCPQAEPTWLTEAFEGRHARSSPPGKGQSEDCLYLDVYAPKKIFDQKGTGSGARVLVWIYGGGYVIGSKTLFDPATLVTVGEDDTNSEGVIFVAMNYRLGAFGWLGGSDFLAQGGSPNNGLLDQRLALEWVQKYITKFGGDPNKVTVMGESGGASSIMRQFTARKANGKALSVPFEQAILQSPAETFLPNNTQSNSIYETFLQNINATNLEEARSVDSTTLKHVNFQMVKSQDIGHFLFSATLDGMFVRGQVANTLNTEGPNKDLEIMTSHNSNEGYIFVPPPKTILSPSFNFSNWVASVLQNAPPQEVAYVTNILYPPANQTTPYSNNFERVNTFASEAFVNCNEYGAQLGFNKSGYAYQFSVYPGIHVQDVYSTFYNGPNAEAPPINVTVATEMQKFITNFASSGNPNAAKLSQTMPKYGANNMMLNFSNESIADIVDTAANPRCDYWIQRKTTATA